MSDTFVITICQYLRNKKYVYNFIYVEKKDKLDSKSGYGECTYTESFEFNYSNSNHYGYFIKALLILIIYKLNENKIKASSPVGLISQIRIDFEEYNENPDFGLVKQIILDCVRYILDGSKPENSEELDKFTNDLIIKYNKLKAENFKLSKKVKIFEKVKSLINDEISLL